MNKEVKDYGSKVAVTEEVAEFLAESKRQLEASGRKYNRHNKVPLDWLLQVPDQNNLKTTGKDYIVNKVIRKERKEAVWKAMEGLPDNLLRCCWLRYHLEMTQEEIAQREGVSKMAICKRLQKLHRLVKAKLPDWPVGDFVD